jgi:hypothetical protein
MRLNTVPSIRENGESSNGPANYLSQSGIDNLIKDQIASIEEIE